MARGENIELSLPEHLNLGSYFLDRNLELGRHDKPAIYYKDQTYSFRDLWLLTNKVGNVLKALHVEPENRVLLVLGDSPEWVAAWLGAMKVGAVGAHAYTYLNAHDYEHLLNLVRPKVVVADATTLDRIRQAARNLKHRQTVLVAGNHLPDLHAGEYNLNLMLQSASDRLEVEPTHRDDIAFWNFSGGTTGKPKGVPHTHADGVIGYESFEYIISYSSDDVILRVPKLFFHYSRDLGCLFPLRNGAALVLFEERTTAPLIFEFIGKYRPTVLLNVPTMMRAMIHTPADERTDLSCIRYCMSSGELLSAQLYDEWVRTFGGEVVNRFGSAESAMGYFCNRPGAVMPGSSGRVAPMAEVKVVDDAGRELPKGEVGLLLARCPSAAVQYAREREKSRTTFLGDDWINTGDLFSEDENEYFWFHGRANETVKVSGVWVSPLEIEKAMEAHPKVKEAAVLGVQDNQGLIVIKAYLVLTEDRNGSDALSQELKQFCKQRLAPHKFPRAIEFVDELPKTGAGKIDRMLLRARGAGAGAN